MKILRISDELHEKIKVLAEKDRRTLNAMAEILLETGMGVPYKGDSPVKSTGISGSQYDSYEKKSAGASPVDVSDLIKAPEYDPAVAERQSSGEQTCCQHPTRPCKHWVWDKDSGEGYKNVLSGRVREAD